MTKLKNISELTECLYCGSETWYQKQIIKGNCEFRTNFDGSEADNGDMHDGLTYQTIGKFAYCSSCHKKIAKLED